MLHAFHWHRPRKVVVNKVNETYLFSTKMPNLALQYKCIIKVYLCLCLHSTVWLRLLKDCGLV